MGKHVAPAGAPADPIVTAALAHRPERAVHHAAVEGPVGWPREPAPEGGRVGWPGDLADAAVPADPARGARRGWRRLLGSRRVA